MSRPDDYEAKVAALEAEVAGMPLDKLAGILQQAGEQIDEHARDCRGDDCEWSYLTEASAVWRAAEIVKVLDGACGLLSRVAELRHSNADTLADLGDEVAGMLEKLKGGLR